MSRTKDELIEAVELLKELTGGSGDAEAIAEFLLGTDEERAEAEEADDRARIVNVGGHRDGGSAS